MNLREEIEKRELPLLKPGTEPSSSAAIRARQDATVQALQRELARMGSWERGPNGEVTGVRR